MADSAGDRDSMISQFCDLTGAAPQEAQQYLSTNRWDLSGAVAEYFTSLDEAHEAQQAATDPEDDLYSAPSASTGPRNLGGAPVAAPQTSGPSNPSTSSKPKAPSKKFATLGDFSSGSHSHSHDDDEDEDDDDDDDDEDYTPDTKRDLYAGGEKSGIAVQDPSDPRNPGRGRGIAEKLLKKATRDAQRGTTEERPTTRFTGTGMTLGSDETPSEAVPDPNARTSRSDSPVHRALTFWRQGFSVDDGPLYRYDDPENQQYLREINAGRAPVALLNVEPGQNTDVEVFKRMDEDYVPPKGARKAFVGSGQRLGSPTPGPGTQSNAPAPALAPTARAATPPATIQIDDSQPTVSLQVRLGDGSRLVSRFNTTHTVGDVYAFVNQARPTELAWVLMTTFPNKELRDKQLALGDMPELKRGGVVVQKWE